MYTRVLSMAPAPFLALLLALSTATALVGCKQGEGDVCQIDDDCEDGLECNAGTRRCGPPAAPGTPDAAPPPDVDASTAN